VKKELIIIGAGGYAKSVLDSFDPQQYDFKGFLDERPDKEEHFGYPVLAHSLEDILHPENFSFFIAIGSDPKRKIWFDRLNEIGADFASVWDSSAIVSPLAKVGKGCFIGKMAIVNAGVEIGDNVVINTMALVEHGSSVENHANISTKAVLNRRGHLCRFWLCSYWAAQRGKLVNSRCRSGRHQRRRIRGNGCWRTRTSCSSRSEVLVSSTYIIAEIGCNHNGDPKLARKMVSTAQECGVDAVKFQTFSADALISRYAPKAEYQIATTGDSDSQLEMTKALELGHKDLLELVSFARSLGLDAFSTAFDLGSMDFLAQQEQKTWKIPSGEITNLPYLQQLTQIPVERVLLSTGMATLDEISTALEVLTSGGIEQGRIALLHCNTEYPTPDCDVNLLAIRALQDKYPGLEIGFSDHSVGALAAAAAVALGASVIEKHFTLDKNLPGPDHKASATPEELTELCQNIRRMELMRGSAEKKVTPSEAKNKIVARKSIVASKPIARGEAFSEDNVTCKRPGNGISPMCWNELMGITAMRDFEEDELIVAEGFSWQE